ncbi:hypothetical protein GCM10022251_38120 [Phytohabitans flavus]|uniref:hypothetical protein n=1 Tax=Phytohabitans flavus TaxID=1076124 RepID=UPI001564E5DF|nr:hypothetical protein [Phytohabitans flavus]
MLGQNNSTARRVVTAGLVTAIILIIVTLVVSLYESVTDSSNVSLLREPEVVAVAIGLILSVLFVERWRSLEGKVDRLSSDQQTQMNELRKSTADQTELAIGLTVDKAEKLSAKLNAIAETHPWLEVITQRDILVETESVRGILRTAYTLLQEGKHLHLYEYLEYSSRKGTPDDPRKSQEPPRPSRPLRGTAEDFLEIAGFCEVWLEDYALSLEFLARYVEGSGNAGYILMPEYILRLLRAGQFPAATARSDELERLLRRDRWHRRVPFLFPRVSISERFRWNAANALAVSHAACGDDRKRDTFANEAQGSGYSRLFPNEQMLFDAEVALNLAQFDKALAMLDRIAVPDENIVRRRDIVLLYERLGAHEKALAHRVLLDERRGRSYGDASNTHDTGAERAAGKPQGGQPDGRVPEPPTPEPARAEGTTPDATKNGASQGEAPATGGKKGTPGPDESAAADEAEAEQEPGGPDETPSAAEPGRSK